MSNTISEEHREKLLRNCRGTYIKTAWEVVDDDGNVTDGVLRPGRWVVVENGYTILVLRVGQDMTLTEHEVEYV